jgi:hypothetical protein
MVESVRRSALDPTGSRNSLDERALSRVEHKAAAIYYGRYREGRTALMAKVSWNRTWSEKMRKRSRGKKGKNRLRKKK